MNQTLIKIGHSAYKDANKYTLCFSKAHAIRVLVGRKVTHKAAKKSIDNLMKVPDSYATIRNENLTVIEIENVTYNQSDFYYSYKELKTYYKNNS